MFELNVVSSIAKEGCWETSHTSRKISKCLAADELADIEGHSDTDVR